MIEFSSNAPSTTCICSHVNGRPCEFHLARPFSVLEADMRFRRAETCPEHIRDAVMRAVDAIERRRVQRATLPERMLARRLRQLRQAEADTFAPELDERLSAVAPFYATRPA